ncbi:MAG TPA: arsenate reductase ArsC [Alphaproteobacteria bacterium]|nr:arsenate reductase ArsC [Alphaproteobacteria bacterium]
MSDTAYNVLFLCTGNSARSIFGEAILNHLGGSRFRAYSAGSVPKGTLHPTTLKVLGDAGIATDGLYSKNWDEFAKPGAPEMDFIITVCDEAVGETCPVWPGQPVTAHWGIADPAAATGSDHHREHAFRDAFVTMERRINLLVNLRPEALDAQSLHHHLTEIHRNDRA